MCGLVMIDPPATLPDTVGDDPNARPIGPARQRVSTERGTPLTPPGVSITGQEREPRAPSPAQTDVAIIPMAQSWEEQRLLA